MTWGKALAAALALAAAFALGVWTGPSLRNRPTSVAAERSPADAPQRANTVARKGPERGERQARASREAPVAKLSASEPDVHKHLKPILNLGTNMEIASEGFRDAEQFAMVAHAARNTQVPFMVLKHRVLNEKKSLAAAIEDSKPSLDATAEARRARDQARKDMAAIGNQQGAEGQVAALQPKD